MNSGAIRVAVDGADPAPGRCRSDPAAAAVVDDGMFLTPCTRMPDLRPGNVPPWRCAAPGKPMGGGKRRAPADTARERILSLFERPHRSAIDNADCGGGFPDHCGIAAARIEEGEDSRQIAGSPFRVPPLPERPFPADGAPPFGDADMHEQAATGPVLFPDGGIRPPRLSDQPAWR